MSAVDHDAGNVQIGVVVFLAEPAFFFVEELADKLVDLLPVEVRRVLCLLEEERRRVLQLFHSIQNIIFESTPSLSSP
jgi:hypothetical protein